MSRNRVNDGKTVTVIAAGTVVPGQFVHLGGFAGVAINGGSVGDSIVLELDGVHTLPKATGVAWAKGVTPLYWDGSADKVTTLSADGVNKPVGVAYAAAASGDTTGQVQILNGIAFIGALEARIKVLETASTAAASAITAIQTAATALALRVTALETP